MQSEIMHKTFNHNFSVQVAGHSVRLFAYLVVVGGSCVPLVQERCKITRNLDRTFVQALLGHITRALRPCWLL